MSGSFLLDTNIVIGLFAQEESIQSRLSESDRVFLPSIVLGELYFGAYKSAHPDENIRRIDELATHLKKNAKDNHSRRGLLQMVASRKTHMKYLEKKNPRRYNALVKKIGLKK